jgi:hypothetical protein
MPMSGGPHRWLLVVQASQGELYEILRSRLAGSSVEVLLERRQRERRRGSLGPVTERRAGDRRRQRPVALVTALPVGPPPLPAAPPVPVTSTTVPPASPDATDTLFRCKACGITLELELPRFPHPPARVEMEVEHVATKNQRPQHYAAIVAFTLSGRMLLSQRVPARPPD